ncbi:MotA/TolQ/ExbB proton channel family protein [Rubrimonas cliftonensis]|uniref:Biopolymer transport protein ExbB n=1 Tax=Rubrimonas cliftonensis TaxID=89524 RepID=A0A1H4BH19_9RHOB|nr:MotA/TolQ/ExbB proton channel family protein [Rubrimonas cliftonensis]SEA47298.1 biopolymer transport protein ExbB [Rubrimonas cliftonensis]
MIGQLGAWLSAGGPVIWLLAALSLASIALIAVKLIELAPARAGAGAREAALQDWAGGARAGPLKAFRAGAAPADRALAAAAGVLADGRDPGAARAAAAQSGAAEIARLGRFLPLLEVIAAISPLLGLLGTVLGMIQSFQELELAAGAANAAVLAGGIWQALLTTAAGLIVAIPAGVAASLMSARVDRVAHDVEDAVGRLLDAAEPRRAA